MQLITRRYINARCGPCCLIALLLLISAGCGSDSELPIVAVTGKVTFAGGPCPKPGTISFSPISVEEGLPRRPGRASFSEDGYFQATSFQEGDGLIPGTYAAVISCWESQPTSEDPGSFERLNYVPSGYRPQFVVEKTAGSVEVDLDVPKKK